jgi:hypothetical protein
VQLSHAVQADAERVLEIDRLTELYALASNQWHPRAIGFVHSNISAFDSTLVTQSTGQTSVLHGLAVKVSGHTAPLPTVGLSTPRVRDAVPPAHVTEQVTQLDQALIMQSTACIEGETDGTIVIGSVGVGVVGLGVGNRVGEGVGSGVGLRTSSNPPSRVKPSRRARMAADHRTSATAMGSERASERHRT